jgi:DNA-binding response OmpR family regulator
MRILLVEDDVGIADAVRRVLTGNYYSVDVARDGEEGYETAMCHDYDLAILDIILPKLDGASLCARLRKSGFTAPILMLTALSSSQHVIDGLEAGADDYLTKPFDLDVFMARVRSLIRRRSEQRTSVISVGDLEIDTAQRRVTRGGVPISLTPKVFALLEYLALNRGRLVTRSEIAEHVWDKSYDPRSNVIETLVHVLRQRLESGEDAPRLIETVRGAGYRLECRTSR